MEAGRVAEACASGGGQEALGHSVRADFLGEDHHLNVSVLRLHCYL